MATAQVFGLSRFSCSQHFSFSIPHGSGTVYREDICLVVQGLPLMTLATLEDVLFTISSLAMKGCFLIGEIPTWLAKTQLEPKVMGFFLGRGVGILSPL